MLIRYYSDDEEIEITSEEAFNSGNYLAKLFIKNLIKKKIYYKNGELYYVVYYKEVGENEEEITNALTGICSFYIKVKTNFPHHYIEDSKYYKNGLFISRSRHLYNLTGSEICQEEIDRDTDLPIYKKTKKHFYQYQWDDYFPMMTARYLEDGELDKMEYGDPNDPIGQDQMFFRKGGSGRFEDIPILAEILNLTAEQISYYLTAELVPSIELDFIDGKK